MVQRLTRAYSLDFAHPESVHNHKARDIYYRACQKCWTKEEFFAQLDKLIETVPFKDWTVADFFKTAAHPKFYTAAWVVKQQGKDHTAKNRMEAYRVGEKTLWRYIPDDDDSPIEGLERVFFRGKWLDDSVGKAIERPGMGEMPCTVAEADEWESKESVALVLENVRYKQENDDLREMLQRQAVRMEEIIRERDRALQAAQHETEVQF